jgi:hypothetical protein
MERKNVKERGGLCFLTADLEVNGSEKKQYKNSLSILVTQISNSGANPKSQLF